MDVGLSGLIQFDNIANLTLTNSNILGVNVSTPSNVVHFVNTSTVTVTDLSSRECEVSGFILYFENNNAYEAGSLVSIQASHLSDSSSGGVGISNHSVSIRDSTFDNISSDNRLTSAITHQNYDDSHLEVSNCSFLNLANSDWVAAIKIARADMYIDASTFINCTAGFAVVFIDNYPLLAGGYNRNETVTVENCNFEDCNATNGLSVLYHLGKDMFPYQQLNVYNSIFRSNTASMGGAITLLAVGFADIVGCTFEENASLGGLGALYAYGWPEQASVVSDRSAFPQQSQKPSLPPQHSSSPALAFTVCTGYLAYASFAVHHCLHFHCKARYKAPIKALLSHLRLLPCREHPESFAQLTRVSACHSSPMFA